MIKLAAGRNTGYLRKFDKEVDDLSKKYNLKREESEDLLDHFFITMKKFIEDERMPKIQITNFGTFRPSTRKINFVIGHWIRMYKRGNMERSVLNEKISKIWKVKQRIISEKLGKETWKEWKKLKLNASK